MIWNKRAYDIADKNIHLIVCISPKHIICTAWTLQPSHAYLHMLQRTITEIPLYFSGHLLNVKLLYTILENSMKEIGNIPARTHFLFELDHNNEQFVTSDPQKSGLRHLDTNVQVTHLYTHEDGANVSLQTTIEPSLLVQVYLLAKKMNFNLDIISSFSLCCLNLYFKTINTQQRQQQLQDDLKKEKFRFSHLPKQNKLDQIMYISDDLLYQEAGIQSDLFAAAGAIAMINNQLS